MGGRGGGGEFLEGQIHSEKAEAGNLQMATSILLKSLTLK